MANSPETQKYVIGGKARTRNEAESAAMVKEEPKVYGPNNVAVKPFKAPKWTPKGAMDIIPIPAHPNAARASEVYPTYPRPEDWEGKPNPPEPRWVKIDKYGRAYGVGGRKAARAVCWIKPGGGHIRINGIPHTEYFHRIFLRGVLLEPFMQTQTLTKFDAWCAVKGGGTSGQAGAIRLAVARALQAYNPLYRPRLKAAHMLTRDPRVVERKKAGRLKARKKKQWVKR